MAWTGLAWTGPACLAWTGMAWTGLACTGPACLDLDFSSSSPGPPLHLDWTCLPGLDWNGLDWTGLDWTCLPVWAWTGPEPHIAVHPQDLLLNHHLSGHLPPNTCNSIQGLPTFHT